MATIADFSANPQNYILALNTTDNGTQSIEVWEKGTLATFLKVIWLKVTFGKLSNKSVSIHGLRDYINNHAQSDIDLSIAFDRKIRRWKQIHDCKELQPCFDWTYRNFSLNLGNCDFPLLEDIPAFFREKFQMLNIASTAYRHSSKHNHFYVTFSLNSESSASEAIDRNLLFNQIERVFNSSIDKITDETTSEICKLNGKQIKELKFKVVYGNADEPCDVQITLI